MESGLENVVAAETVLSDVDGLNGRLIVRGYMLDELVRQRFEEVAALLFDGFFDALPAGGAFDAALGAARVRVFAQAAALDDALAAMPPVDAMRALLARLPDGDDLATAFDLLAAPAVFTPAVLPILPPAMPQTSFPCCPGRLLRRRPPRRSTPIS